MMATLAYKYVAMMLMVSESNFFCANTGLPIERPFTEGDVRTGSHVGPFNPKDFSGSILTDQYFFGFGWGHLANFRKRGFMPQDSDQAIRQRNLELSEYSSLIDTNGALQLATNWLAALTIDVTALEAKYRRNVIQWRFYRAGKDGPVIMLPVYQVEWRGAILRSQPKRESAVVTVTVFGATKELVEYHVLDDSLFLRRRIAIPNAEKLLAIPDEEFRKFDALQRSNLFVRFTIPVDSKPSGTLPQNAPTNTVKPARREEEVPKLPGSPTRLGPAANATPKSTQVPRQPGDLH